MKFSRYKGMLLAVILISAAATLVLLEQLPETIATRWTQNGEVTAEGPRMLAVLTSLLPLLAWWLIRQAPSVSSDQGDQVKHPRAYAVTIVFFLLLLIGIHWLIMLYNLGVVIRSDGLIKFGIAAALFLLARVLPSIKYGHSVGIRTPWSIASESNWRRTHRFASVLFYLTSAAFLAALPAGGRSSFWIGIGALLLTVMAVYLYSYFITPKEERSA